MKILMSTQSSAISGEEGDRKQESARAGQDLLLSGNGDDTVKWGMRQ